MAGSFPASVPEPAGAASSSGLQSTSRERFFGGEPEVGHGDAARRLEARPAPERVGEGVGGVQDGGELAGGPASVGS